MSAIENFFVGKKYNSEEKGESLESYLNFLNSEKNGTSLSESITDQFKVAKETIDKLNNDFASQVALASFLSSGSTGVVVVLVCLVSVLLFLKLRRLRFRESVGRWCDSMMEDVSVEVRRVGVRARRVGR